MIGLAIPFLSFMLAAIAAQFGPGSDPATGAYDVLLRVLRALGKFLAGVIGWVIFYQLTKL